MKKKNPVSNSDRVADATLICKGGLHMKASNTAQKRIDKWQIKAIYTLGQSLGLVDRMVSRDALHELVESVSDKMHVTDLSFREANDIIDRLKGNMKGIDRIKAGTNISTNRPGMASLPQINKIKAQMYELKKYDIGLKDMPLDERLNGFLNKNVKIESLSWLTKQDAIDVIEGLKGLIITQKKKLKRYHELQKEADVLKGKMSNANASEWRELDLRLRHVQRQIDILRCT